MIHLTDSKKEYKSARNINLSALQSWEWGLIKSNTTNWKPHRLILNKSVGVTIFERPIPFTKFKLGYLPRLFLDSKESLTEIVEYAKDKLDLDIVLIDPAWEKGHLKLDNVSSTKQIQPNFTNLVDLSSKSEEDLWMGMSGKYRRNIKKALKHDVLIKIVNKYTEKAVNDFIKVMESVSENTDFIMMDKNYFHELFKVFCEDGKSRMYLAYDAKDNVVGGYLVIFGEDTALELYGGVLPKGRDLEAGYALKWESIKDSGSIGLSFYDHWGISPFEVDSNGKVIYETNHPLHNISKFKNGFGGKNIQYEKQLIYYNKKSLYIIYRLSLIARSNLLSLKKFIKRPR